ncbi:uncharacterized protein METZ01_LOCUS180660 [marine metagenome]|uniref:Uncharacterized protein n=1 Tax=marine metagenome TaxID=408172 RepID=A0A382CNT1_9ZZZZ
MIDNFNEQNGVLLQGHIKIHDPDSGKIFVDKRNAIHYENMSLALADSLANQGEGFVNSMVFGNGGTSVDPTGIITYLSPNSTGTNASLYSQTYTKIIDDNSVNNTDPTRNKLETRHVSGTNYTDILATCLLDYGEPSGQDAIDNATGSESLYVFDELGLISYAKSGTGRLLTHVVFHPVQKSLNRLIQIDYTVRVQSLTGFNEA